MSDPRHMVMYSSPDLSVMFCGIRLSAPLVLASGPLGETAGGLAPFLDAGAGAVVTRTLRLRADPTRQPMPHPHITLGPHRSYMLNCETGNRVPWEYWRDEGLTELQAHGPVIVSLSGRTIDNCVALAAALEGQGVSLFEINISCSHAGLLYGRIADDSDHVQRLVSGLKRAVTTPIMMKLGHGPALPEIARLVEQAGADAISVTNSIGPGLDVRLSDGRPKLGGPGGFGGVSGPAIFPIALQCVHAVVKVVKIPVMGIGGVASYREVAKMLMVGAVCVQIYTGAHLRGPALVGEILAGLRAHLTAKQLPSVDALRGLSRPYLG